MGSEMCIRDRARVVGAHERAHLQAITNLLGRNAVKNPGFNYGSVTAVFKNAPSRT